MRHAGLACVLAPGATRVRSPPCGSGASDGFTTAEVGGRAHCSAGRLTRQQAISAQARKFFDSGTIEVPPEFPRIDPRSIGSGYVLGSARLGSAPLGRYDRRHRDRFRNALRLRHEQARIGAYAGTNRTHVRFPRPAMRGTRVREAQEARPHPGVRRIAPCLGLLLLGGPDAHAAYPQLTCRLLRL